MSIDLGSAFAKIKIDTSDLDAAAERSRGALGRIQGSFSGLKGALSGTATAITTAFAGIGVGAVAGFGAAMKSAISMNAVLETSTLQFQTLMGDADRARDHVKSLFDFAASTPFETEPIIAASKHLQTFGGDALNSMENLKLVGDAAAAVGQPIDGIAFWIGRAYSAIESGEPFGEAAARLQEMGVLGPQARQALEDLQKAGAPASEIFGELQNQLGSFAGAMELQAGTWEGLTSTIKDNLSLLAAETLKPLIDLIKDGMGGLVEFLSSETVQNAVANITAGIQAAAGAIAGFISNLREGMSPIDSFIEAIWNIAPQPVLDMLVRFRDDVLPGLTAAVRSIVDPIVNWVRNNVELRDVLMVVGAAVAATVIPAIVSLVSAFAPVIAIFAAAVAAVALLRNAWESNFLGIRDRTQAVGEFVIGAVGRIRDFIGVAVENIKQWWAENGEAILASVQRVWGLVRDFIDGVVTTIKGIVEAFQLAFRGDWEGFGEKIVETWINAWKTSIEFLLKLWDMIRPHLTEMWNRVKGFFTETDWKSLGRSIIEGIINGVTELAGNLWEALKGIARGGRRAFSEAIEEGSPARLFISAGENIVLGIIEGVNRAKPLLERALEGLASVSQIGSGFGGIWTRQITAQITPIQSSMESAIRQLAPFWSDAAIGNVLGMDPARRAEALRAMRMDPINTANPEAARRMQEAIRLADERNRLEQEYIRQQQTLAALEEQRSRYDLLKQQFDLIKLIKDNGLSTSILSGIRLGLDADLGGILQAMTEAMRQLVETAEDELQIASPSRIFNRIGRNIMQSMALGIAQEKTLADAFNRSMQINMRQTVVAGPQQAAIYIYGGANFSHEATYKNALEELYFGR